MVFTSFNFLIFFPIIAVLYFVTPAKYKVLVLLAASYFFYINISPVYAVLLFTVTFSTFFFTKLIDSTTNDVRKRSYMLLNITIVLLPLFFFKYFGAVNSGIITILQNFNIRWPLPEIKLLLPIGISFYTFMAIGYTIDVYNEEIEAEKDISVLALFISFFPLIMSGPIERAKNMLPQFRQRVKPSYQMVVQGLKMMLWGYFMKLVVADRAGIYIDAIFLNAALHNGTSVLFASVLYPFQVYADLGGYSLIAIGAARLLGINVIPNFKRPFFATSMAEFWRRWHISLISWLTDYVYTPLSFAFRKYKVWGIVIALMITFLISGIWHGAALTFIVWGFMQGVFLCIEALTNKRRVVFEQKYKLNSKAWYIGLCCIVTFILFTASQIFARAETVNAALEIYTKIFSTAGPLFIGTPSILIFALLGIAMLIVKDFTDEFTPNKFLLYESRHKPVRIMAYSLTIIFILLIGVFDGGEFIYFKF
jgi:alginate O-acetyltransferase complex protein AlgI